jgi:hypothetical protein
MGDWTKATGDSSIAMGDMTKAYGDSSIAMGNVTTASGDSSIAMGDWTTASGDSSVAIGSKTTASGICSIAMGDNTTAESGYETVIGRYDTSYIPVNKTGWDISDRLFVIGNGTSDTSRSDALVVLKSGNVGINTSSPDYRLHVDGTAYATGAAGELSDRRYKKNIENLKIDALKVVKKLNPVTFQWKEPKDKGMEGIQLGFIAQEVEEVFPEVILTQDNKEKTKGLKYTALIALLTKAIKELIEENTLLRERIEALEAKIQ